MKKVILVIAALVLVISGVAAVSAYEAHLINVRAHVENAIDVTVREINFGTVFPEEWMTKQFTVQTSGSFCKETQTRVGNVDYEIWVEWKPAEGMDFAYWDGADWVQSSGFYNWMGYFTYIGAFDAPPGAPLFAGDLTMVGDPPAGVPGTSAKFVAGPFTLSKFAVSPPDLDDKVVVGIDAPVFDGYYNMYTDPEPKPSGLNDPTYIIPADMPGFDSHGMDFGLDLKIQVVNIYNP
jgi:hypothetical protein